MDAAIYACDCSGEELKHHSLAMYQLLSAEQREVIARLLRYVAENRNEHRGTAVARRALDAYWQAFLDG